MSDECIHGGHLDDVKAALIDTGRPDLAELIYVRAGNLHAAVANEADYRLCYRAASLVQWEKNRGVCWDCGINGRPCPGITRAAALRYETCAGADL